MASRVVVTGGSGKLGRAVVADLAAAGYEVFNVDRVGAPGSRGAVGPDRLRAGGRGAVRDRGPVRVGRRGRAPGGRAGAGADRERGDVPAQHHGDAQRLRRGPPGRRPQRGVGELRDAARAAVRHAPTAALPGGRGVRGPAAVLVLAGQAPRGADGRPVLPVGPPAQDDRAAVLQRDGAGGLRRASRATRPTRACAAGTPGATSTPGTVRRPYGWPWNPTSSAWRSS